MAGNVGDGHASEPGAAGAEAPPPRFQFLLCGNRLDERLDACLESLNALDCDRPPGIIFVANGPERAAIAARVAGLLSVRFQPVVLETEIEQLTYCLNLGIDRSSADYLVRLDADDRCLPDRITRIERLLAERGAADIVAGGAIVRRDGEATKVSPRPLDWKVYFRNPFIHPACTYRRAFLIECRGYTGSLAQDVNLLFAALRAGPPAVLVDPEPHIEYAVHEAQTSRTRRAYAAHLSYQLFDVLTAFRFVKLAGFTARLGRFLLFGHRFR